MKVLALVDRNTGRSRAMVVDRLSALDIAPIMTHNIAREANLVTDEAKHYHAFANVFASHRSISHKKGEYARGEVHTNTIEGYFSIFKRGMKGRGASPHLPNNS